MLSASMRSGTTKRVCTCTSNVVRGHGCHGHEVDAMQALTALPACMALMMHVLQPHDLMPSLVASLQTKAAVSHNWPSRGDVSFKVGLLGRTWRAAATESANQQASWAYQHGLIDATAVHQPSSSVHHISALRSRPAIFEIQTKLSQHMYTALLSCTQLREAVGVGTWKGCLPLACPLLM